MGWREHEEPREGGGKVKGTEEVKRAGDRRPPHVTPRLFGKPFKFTSSVYVDFSCHVRNIRTCRDFFIRLYLSQTDNFARKQELRCSREWTVWRFFYTFAIKEGAKEEIRVENLRDGIAGAGTGFWASSGVVMP